MRPFLGALGIASFGLCLSAPAMAAKNDDGVSWLHAQVRVGNKVCFVDHTHQGNSSGQASKKAALAAAISDYQGFTGWEYGSAWGRFSLAADKRVSCSGGPPWGCTVEARPCRRR
ncbi:MAG: hypothetical protein R3D68_01465 [Hyphomicrobiaceae bacterium]